jgi:cytochrome P450
MRIIFFYANLYTMEKPIFLFSPCFQIYSYLKNEMFCRNGENWSKARTVVNQPMMQPRAAKEYVPKIDQVARDFTER